MTSKAVRVKAAGKLELVTEEKVKASPGNIVVRITLRPVNPADILSYRIPDQLPVASFMEERFVLGSEGVGYVDEVGECVTRVKVGQRVVPAFYKKFYTEGNGSWQQYIEISENDVFVPPESLSDEIACQAIVNPWTAYGIVQDQNVPKDEWVIQNAATSQVARQVIQLAKFYGFKTINVVRRDDAIDDLKAIGADVIINSKKEDVVKKVKEVTGGKLCYGGLDAVAGEGSKMVAACVRDGGKLFLYGLLSSTDITISFADISRVQISWWILFQKVPTLESTQAVAAAVFRLLDEKIISPQPAVKRFRLENFQDAIELSLQEGRGGKVLLES